MTDNGHDNTARERPAPGDRLEVVLESPAPGGEAVAHTRHGAVFVADGLPGEHVEVELSTVKKRFAKGRVVRILESAAGRVADRRELLGASGVGGIEYACADLALSRRLKSQAATDQLARIGGIEWPVTVQAAPREARADAAARSPAQAWRVGTDWRTRVQLAVAAGGKPGMLAPASHTVLPVEHLPLAVAVLDALGVQHLELPGAQRIELAAGAESGAIVVAGDVADSALTALRALADERGWSLVHRAAGRRNRTRPGHGGGGAKASTRPSRLLTGPGYLTQRVGDLDFRVRPEGFWQVHNDAAAVLGAAVTALIAGAQHITDLYCGAGLFSLLAATATGATVHGIEGSPGAVADARANARRLLARGAGRASFTATRIETLHTLPSADTIVADPPRAGLGRDVVNLITASPAEKLVYVSCDGGTFARDARALLAGGFRLTALECHDLFPLTGHVEFVSEFVR